MKSMGGWCSWSAGLLCLALAGAAHAQRQEVEGLSKPDAGAQAYAQPEGGSMLRLVTAAELAGKPRVLEFNMDHSRARVNLAGQDLWLERRALRLVAEAKGSCHVVASSRAAPPMGASRGANSGCDPAPTGKP